MKFINFKLDMSGFWSHSTVFCNICSEINNSASYIYLNAFYENYNLL